MGSKVLVFGFQGSGSWCRAQVGDGLEAISS